jgi:hypothetical protein
MAGDGLRDGKDRPEMEADQKRGQRQCGDHGREV